MLSLTRRLFSLLATVTAAGTLVACPLIVGSPPAEAQLARRVVVSNEGADTVTIIDAASLRIAATIRVGPRPHNLAGRLRVGLQPHDVVIP